MRSLPTKSTALDFAFEIHSEIGEHCIGAKVNHRLVPLSYELKSGDQVELLTSVKQNPKEDWLNYVITAKAKSKIKHALKEQRRKISEEGKGILEKKFSKHKLDFNPKQVSNFATFLKLPNVQELYYRIAKDAVDNKLFKEYVKYKDHPETYVSKKQENQTFSIEQLVADKRGKSDWLVIGDDMQKLDYKLSSCCNPIPGDDVFGFVTVNEGIKIHRINCANAIQLLSNYAYRVVKAKWNSQHLLAFLAGIRITGTDEIGIVNNITKVISTQYYVNMRSISFDTDDGVFEGTIMVYVNSTDHLTQLITKLKRVKGVVNVVRIDGDDMK
jgi:GTP pyrophosphokinase